MRGYTCDGCGVFGSDPKHPHIPPEGWLKLADRDDTNMEHYCPDCMHALRVGTHLIEDKPDTSNPNPPPRGPWWGMGIFR